MDIHFNRLRQHASPIYAALSQSPTGFIIMHLWKEQFWSRSLRILDPAIDVAFKHCYQIDTAPNHMLEL